MRQPSSFKSRFYNIAISLVLVGGLISSVHGEITVRGQVLDTNGRAVKQAQVTMVPGAFASGPTAITVFTDDSGGFVFPEPITVVNNTGPSISVRALGYKQLHPTRAAGDGDSALTILMQHSVNQAGVAPASAWLKMIQDPLERNEMVMACVGCHQHPAPEVREYASAIHAVAGADPGQVRKQSWGSIVKYMNFLTTEEFGRGNARVAAFNTKQAYTFSLGKRDATDLLCKYLTGPLDHVEGYEYGAPLAVTPSTVIKEYEVARPNAIREAAMMGTPPRLWVADVDSNRIIRIDPVTGAQKEFIVPADVFIGPHTLHPGKDDHLWIAPQFNSTVARLNTVTEEWRLWKLQTKSGGEIGIHDLTFDWRHELVTDTQGRVWFSDIVNNAVGYLNPETGEHGIYPVPQVPGRPGKGAALYGIVMTSDRQHIWYSQLGIGSFGSFNTESLEFEEQVVLPEFNSGPRRLAISDKDILYVPLFGAGQLVEYDTRVGKQLGIYDLPDRASAPYAATWDAGRQVLWIPTSNANAIYRFDPASKSFSVLPLPREGAFLRMLLVDHNTGMLVTSYANILKRVHGPRMAVLIDPGDSKRVSIRTAFTEVNDHD